MTAIPNANGNDVWWICRDRTNHFYSFKLTCQGFQKINPVISTVGNNVNNDINLLSAGDIIASPDGNFVAAAYRDYFEIYKFDKLTGILSNSIKIPVFASYGVEFSPDSRYLYISVQGFPDLNTPTGNLQYDLSNYDSTAIYNSATTLTTVSGSLVSSVCGLQLGPNGKIYVATFDGFAIPTISFPNKPGNLSGLQESAIIMPNQIF